MTPIIATRADLDTLQGTPAHDQFLAFLRGTLTTRANTQAYPDGYDSQLQPGDAGYLPPIWLDMPDSSVAARYGFTPEELQ
jgi:hypothetical protein